MRGFGLQATGSGYARPMSRDHTKLKVYHLADELVVDVYRATAGFPPEERYGLQAQMRRAAVRCPSTLVEGCARTTTRDYKHFVTIALGSASEVRYMFGLAQRLGFLQSDVSAGIRKRYDELVRSLQSLVSALERQA